MRLVKRFTETKGSALIMAVVVSVLVATLSVTGLSLSMSKASMGSSVLDGIRAFYFAEAGIQRAFYEIKTKDDPTKSDPYPWSFAGQTVNLTITPTETLGAYTVTSSCTYNQTQKAVTATVSKQGSNITVSEWAP
jgi:Tfp pilus assembly protein PilX